MIFEAVFNWYLYIGSSKLNQHVLSLTPQKHLSSNFKNLVYVLSGKMCKIAYDQLSFRQLTPAQKAVAILFLSESSPPRLSFCFFKRSVHMTGQWKSEAFKNLEHNLENVSLVCNDLQGTHNAQKYGESIKNCRSLLTNMQEAVAMVLLRLIFLYFQYLSKQCLHDNWLMTDRFF